MGIVIKMPDEKTNTFAIIELQGDLKSSSETAFQGKFIGDLHFTKTGSPLLIIGHHLLFGKVTTLEKPIALLKKEKSTEVTSEFSENSTEYTVSCIITRKIIFKIRPKPLVATPKGKQK